MNKKKEVLSEAIMLAFEYSKDSKKILSAFEQAIRFETTGTQRLFLCPYSDAVYACKSQSIENNVELQSYFDNLDTPQRESTRENLHDSFNEVYNELKDNVTAKKKTLFFVVSSQHATLTYSPYQYMSSHIAGIKIHFIALESMKDKLEPFVKSNLLNTDATYVKAKSLLDGTYSQEKTTEVICDILTVISEISPEIKISDVAKAVKHEKMDPDDMYNFFCDDDDDGDDIHESFWHKSRTTALRIAQNVSGQLVKRHPEHIRLIHELESSFYKAISNQNTGGVRGIFTIIDRDRNIDQLLMDFQEVLKESFDLPTDNMDTGIYSAEIEGVTSALGSPPEYKGSTKDGGRWISLMNAANGDGVIIIKNCNLAAPDMQGVLSTLIDQATIENKYTKKRLNASGIYVIVTVSTEGIPVPDDVTNALIKISEEKPRFTTGLAQRLSSWDVAFTAQIEPVVAFPMIKSVIQDTVNAFESGENIQVHCDSNDLSKLLMYSTMQFATAKRKAADLLQESISKHIAPLLKSKKMSLQDLGKLIIESEDTEHFFENIEAHGFAYSQKATPLDNTGIDIWHNIPTRKDILTKQYDFCLLYPKSHHDSKCSAIIKTLQTLQHPIPVFIVAEDQITSNFFMLKSGVTASVVLTDLGQTQEWIRSQIEAVVFQKCFRTLKNAAQHIAYDIECDLSNNCATVRLCGFCLEELFDKPDEQYLREHSGTSSVRFEDIVGLDEQKSVISAIADDPEADRILLLVGPPGTGKTLLASALSQKISENERCKFLSYAATDFLRGVVGQSEEELKKMFDLVRKYPDLQFVVFIDELDSISQQRGRATAFGEHTQGILTVFLNELNGFHGTPQNLILVGASNHMDAMDPALLRRFNRILEVPIPKEADTRAQLVKDYFTKRKIHPCTNDILGLFVSRSAGLSPSIIKTVLDTARRNAKRKGTTFNEELLPALETHLFGEENVFLSQASKRKTAVHEIGHVLLARHFNHKVDCVSIVARANFSGLTSMAVDESKPDMSKEEILQEISILTAGRAAEVLFFGEQGITTGASQDFLRASELALSFVRNYAMGKSLLCLSLENLPDAIKLRQIEEAENILESCYSDAMDALKKERQTLQALSEYLFANSTLTERDINEFLTVESAI